MTKHNASRTVLEGIARRQRLLTELARDLDYRDPLAAVIAAADRIAARQWMDEHDRITAQETAAERRLASLAAYEAAVMGGPT